MKLSVALLCLTTSALGSLAPTVGLEVGLPTETFEAPTGTTSRAQLRTLLFVGLAHPVREAWSLDGHFAVGVGPTLETGHWSVLLREDVTWALHPWKALEVRLGVSLGGALDATSVPRSTFDAGLVVAVRFGAFELAYRPAYAVALGAETRTVLGGVERLSGAGWQPLCLTARLRFW